MTATGGALRLLAGAPASEREAPQRHLAERDWHIPEHVRRPAEARARLVGQIHAGADAITAPTFRTSRRALAPYGETRRAAEWTAAAVRVAREAVEAASERRPAAAAGVLRPPVLVCGPLSPLGEAADSLQSEDYRAQAETMAEAGVDVLLIELLSSAGQAREASLAAAAIGLPVWSGVALTGDGSVLSSGELLGEWLEAVEPAAPERLLVYAADMPALRRALDELGRLTATPLGACFREPPADPGALATAGNELLERDATLLGVAAGARPDALAPLRAAIDARLEASAALAAAALAELEASVQRASAVAPGGSALWLGTTPQIELPPRFEWTIAPPAELGLLPEDHYRLVIVDPASEGEAIAQRLPALLETGGVLLVPRDLARSAGDGLRVLEVSHDERRLTLLRRD